MLKNYLKTLNLVLISSIVALSSVACSGSSSNENSDESVTPATSPSIQATQGSGTNGAVGSYITYEVFNAEKASYADSNVVLFFNASWCSTCKKARDNFESSLSEIPEDVTIVVVDFDDSTELRQKHGVTLQHTFIQVDSAGEQLAKWSGSTTIVGILENII